MTLKIKGVTVRQNESGLYSLNDLHKASQKGRSKDPNEFLQLKSTSEYINLLNTEIPVELILTTKGGRHGGTWVHKDLVYDYAMWCSPTFKRSVIQAFDALTEGRIQDAIKLAMTATHIQNAGKEFKAIASDPNIPIDEAINRLSKASSDYDTNSSIAGTTLSACRGKKAERAEAEKAITKPIQPELI